MSTADIALVNARIDAFRIFSARTDIAVRLGAVFAVVIAILSH